MATFLTIKVPINENKDTILTVIVDSEEASVIVEPLTHKTVFRAPQISNSGEYKKGT